MQVVWFADMKWDALRTRKQQIVRRRPADVTVMFCEAWQKGRVNAERVRSVDGIHAVTVPVVKSIPGGPLRLLLNVPAVRRAVDARVTPRLRRYLADLGFHRPVIVVSNVYAIHVAMALDRSLLVYDCNDAHTAFPNLPSWTRSYYEETCRAADLVFATAQSLRDDVARIRGAEAAIEPLGNGVEYGTFAGAEYPAAPGAGSKVRIGYLGALAPWVDFELLTHVAQARPDWEVALVGPVMNGADGAVDRIARLPNVSVRGHVPHEEVPAVMSAFTIGTIPFRHTELTRGVNPNKMYEYLAVGLPVAATPFSPEVRQFPEYVKTGDGAEGFLSACDAAVLAYTAPVINGPFPEKARRFAAQFDWEPIAGRFWQSVRDAVHRSTPS